MSDMFCSKCGTYVGESDLSEEDLKERLSHLPIYCVNCSLGEGRR